MRASSIANYQAARTDGGGGSSDRDRVYSRTRRSDVMDGVVDRAKANTGRVYNRTWRRSWALIATMIVLSDISTAPTAGERTTPHGASTPAARGMAMML